MPFGISPAPEEFQRRLHESLEGFNGARAIHDDILVYGSGDSMDEAVKDHDVNLRAVFERCRKKGIKLNFQKMKLRKTSVSYLGRVISCDGLKADPAKVEAIVKMPVPTDKQGIQRVLGLTNFVQRFAPKLSQATAPFRELLKTGVAFKWDEDVHSKALDEVKQILSSAPVLKYFNPELDIVIQCDASEKGLGTCLLQNSQPIMYVSRALTDNEVNCAQIEKELLAIVFGMEKFDNYVYGRHVLVESDHKPLETIVKKSLLGAPKRLQRMLLRLQRYDYEVTYKKGTQMVLADTLSRAYLPNKSSRYNQDDKRIMMVDERSTAEIDTESISMVEYVPVTSQTFSEIAEASSEDTEIKALISIIKQGWPDSRVDVPVQVQKYFNYREELSFQHEVVFKGDIVVVPKEVRPNILKKSHASHIGVQGCLRRAREAVFWPNMNRELTDYISKCETCALYSESQQKEPLVSRTQPSQP